MKLAQHKRPWPSFTLPEDRGAITVADVVRAPVGEERDKLIDEWCAAVWNAYRDSRGRVASLLEQHGVL